MPDIYNILSKHFLGETNPQEEEQIAQFRKTHPEEYKTLQQFWRQRLGDVKEFDTEKAWKTVQQKMAAKSKPVVPLYRKWQRVAAAAVLLVMMSVAGYYGYHYYQNAETTIVQTFPGHRAEPVLLADGSKVWLDKGARLIYAKNFGKKKRKVKLSGKAYFEVTHNPEKPFSVELTNGSVTVLGTSFNICSADDSTKVTVATGKVRVANAENTAEAIITPGYEATVKGGKVVKNPVSDANYLAWKTGKFIFRETGVREAIRQLNTYYNNRIQVKENGDSDCLLTAEFNQAKLEDVIAVIELTCDIQIVVLPEQKTSENE